MNILPVSIALVLLAAATGVFAQEGYLTTPDKVRIFYKIEGSGTETLVIVHGGPGNSLESIRPDLGPLAKGRRVIYYDQRGQGKSEVITDGARLGYEHHVADLEAVRQHFKLDKMTLLGNSWGGMLISLYAIEHPDRIERMILHNPGPPMKGFSIDQTDEIGRRAETMFTKKQRDRLKFAERSENWLKAKDPIALCREFFIEILKTYTHSRTMDIGFKGDVCAGPKESVRQWRAVNYRIWDSLGDFNFVPKLSAVKAPVLIIHGAADVIPLRGSEFWSAGYPNGRLLLIQNAGHISHVETPDIFFPAVEMFLKGAFPPEAKKIERPGGIQVVR